MYFEAILLFFWFCIALYSFLIFVRAVKQNVQKHNPLPAARVYRQPGLILLEHLFPGETEVKRSEFGDLGLSGLFLFRVVAQTRL